MSKAVDIRAFGMRMLASLACVAGCASCDVETYLNQTALFGREGATAPAGAPINSGGRGTIQVVFENNTNFRAVFTYGMFDNTDETSAPFFRQFSPDSQLISPTGALPTLEGNTSSGVVVMPCARVFSMGSASLLNLISNNARAISDLIDDAGLIEGVGFSDARLSSDEAGDPNQGFSPAYEARLGVDFNCGSLILVRLEFDDVGANRFRIETEVFPSRGGQ